MFGSFYECTSRDNRCSSLIANVTRHTNNQAGRQGVRAFRVAQTRNAGSSLGSGDLVQVMAGNLSYLKVIKLQCFRATSNQSFPVLKPIAIGVP